VTEPEKKNPFTLPGASGIEIAGFTAGWTTGQNIDFDELFEKMPTKFGWSFLMGVAVAFAERAVKMKGATDEDK
jgi:hypothetical protein